MTQLSPEDIRRAREWREKHGWHLTFIGDWTDERVAAYSAAENERLTLERDRLKGALEKYGVHPQTCKILGSGMVSKSQRKCTCGLLAALRPEGG